MSDKIAERHLQRRAILYVRQSTQQQLTQNEESRRLQYAMRERLSTLGWREIEVIDEDLGKSASGVVERSGFRRLVADVSLGHVGAVAAREVSRFARNSRDWQQLIEICRVVDTLLIDHDTVYAPRQSNDRLLLGLKGSLNEYELDLLRMRGVEARREKASRGELVAGVPVGYRENEEGNIEKTPDVRVRQGIELVFAKFFEIGSARQVMLWLRERQIQLPVNENRHGKVSWKDATGDHVHRILTNPAYAGAYAYGRTKQGSRFVDGEPRTFIARQRRDAWAVLLHDHHEAYISWQEFEQAEQMLSRNAQSRGGHGVARGGSALVAGLIWCRRCGRRMNVSYSGDRLSYGRYRCDQENLRDGAPKCISFGALDADARVAEQVLAVARPAAIEAAHRASLASSDARDQALDALELQLQEARYQAQRAQRQYDAVDPDNRTVARELERRWNEALDVAQSIEDRLVRARSTPRRSAPPDVAHFKELATDLERVWNADTTDMALKKRIVRALLQTVWADIDEARREIVLTMHWKGGAHTELRVVRRRTGEHRRQTSPDVVDAVRALAHILPDQQIALWLGRAGMRTPTGAHYTRALVASVRHLRSIEAFSEERSRIDGWLNCEQAAALLDVDPKTMRRAAERNDVPALHPLPNGPWIFARADLVGAVGAERVATRARTRRTRWGAGPNPQQKKLDIPDT
jgi:DNA invertase Pin-like site-specific DNA recombinase